MLKIVACTSSTALYIDGRALPAGTRYHYLVLGLLINNNNYVLGVS